MPFNNTTHSQFFNTMAVLAGDYFPSQGRIRMRLLTILLCLFVSFNAYSQNKFQRVKRSTRGIRIKRTITVLPQHANLAYTLASRRALLVEAKVERTIAHVTAEYKQPVDRPYKIAGGYNYLKMIGKAFKKRPEWRFAGDSGIGGYNGAHHIVTQTAITEIAKELDIADPVAMKANAPAVYSLLHNHPLYSDLFHDHQTILNTYHKRGVYGVVTDFFTRLNEVNKRLGIPLYDEKFIELELLEAELWAKHWGIKWK